MFFSSITVWCGYVNAPVALPLLKALRILKGTFPEKKLENANFDQLFTACLEQVRNPRFEGLLWYTFEPFTNIAFNALNHTNANLIDKWAYKDADKYMYILVHNLLPCCFFPLFFSIL